MLCFGCRVTTTPMPRVTMPKNSTHPHDFPMMRRTSRSSGEASTPPGPDIADLRVARAHQTWLAPATTLEPRSPGHADHWLRPDHRRPRRSDGSLPPAGRIVHQLL